MCNLFGQFHELLNKRNSIFWSLLIKTLSLFPLSKIFLLIHTLFEVWSTYLQNLTFSLPYFFFWRIVSNKREMHAHMKQEPASFEEALGLLRWPLCDSVSFKHDFISFICMLVIGLIKLTT